MNNADHITPADLADLLKNVRKDEGWKQTEIALLTDLSQTTVARFEKAEGLDQICRVLKWLALCSRNRVLKFDGSRWTVQRLRKG